MENFTCSQCGLEKPVSSDGGTGYGLDRDNNKICYACCAVNDAKALDELKPKEKLCFYWNGKEVTNWPGSLRIKPTNTHKGRHNIARTQETVYFRFHGNDFIGRQYGQNTQILHVKKTARS